MSGTDLKTMDSLLATNLFLAAKEAVDLERRGFHFRDSPERLQRLEIAVQLCEANPEKRIKEGKK